jgi:hypothetical protein
VFTNTHGLTSDIGFGAVNVIGGRSNSAVSDLVEGNTFRNFNRPVQVCGTVGLTIRRNSFQMDLGWDSGSTAGLNVGIWSFDNVNGYTTGTLVESNDYDGCASGDVTSTTSRSCGDGLVFGQYRDAIITNNTIRRFS